MYERYFYLAAVMVTIAAILVQVATITGYSIVLFRSMAIDLRFSAVAMFVALIMLPMSVLKDAEAARLLVHHDDLTLTLTPAHGEADSSSTLRSHVSRQ